MGKIVLLPPEVYNRIAAGEVIENPASVIKELIENSLDANSSEIIIKIKDAGKKEISVTDNGEGMTEEDALLAIKKHSTSKIKKVEDLENIETYGFRGEALSSIVSVSRTEIITRQKSMDSAVRLVIENSGKKVNKFYIQSKVGTTIKVLSLFYNTPARLKFLKSNNTELKYIKQTLTSIALTNPQIKFEVYNDENRDIMFYQQENILNRICEIFGEELREDLIYIESGDNYFKVQGYISKPAVNRPTRNFQYLFLNNRPITAKYFNFWISEAYKDLIIKGRFPIAFIYLTAAPDFVDINVHPSKKEVRFLNEYFVGNKIIKTIKSNLTPEIGIPTLKNLNEKRIEEGIADSIKNSISKFLESENETELTNHKTASLNYEQTVSANKTLNFFTLFNTYIFIQKDDEVLIIDQHAAHERVIYERLKKEIEKEENLTQNLLLPINLNLSPVELEVLKKHQDILRKLGFVFEDFGGNSVAIYGVPSYIRHKDDKNLFKDIIADLMANKKIDKLNLKEEVLKTISCKSAIKAGDYLSYEEKEILIKDLLEKEERYTCPHGRPAVVKLSKKEIEKWFARK